MQRTLTVVEVRLLYFDGCPNWRDAEQRLRQALEQLGLSDSAVSLQRVETAEDAERLAFHGSPTILVDGVDPFADPATPIGLACRVYRTPDGSDGAPTVAQLTNALASAQ
jgi:hypothetical protein